MSRKAFLAVALAGAALMGCASTRVDVASDRAQLLALHEQAMEAHRKSDVELLLKDDGADFVLASRGEISRPSLEQRRQFLGPYLRSVKFSEYADMVPPVVHVSDDGTTGWVIVQIKANGVASNGSGKTLQFESAWIELYQKRDGAWKRVGNVSNFK